MNWSKSEINHIRVSLRRCNPDGLADELGRAKENVKQKIKEIEMKQKLSKLSEYAKDRI